MWVADTPTGPDLTSWTSLKTPEHEYPFTGAAISIPDFENQLHDVTKNRLGEKANDFLFWINKCLLECPPTPTPNSNSKSRPYLQGSPNPSLVLSCGWLWVELPYMIVLIINYMTAMDTSHTAAHVHGAPGRWILNSRQGYRQDPYRSLLNFLWFLSEDFGALWAFVKVTSRKWKSRDFHQTVLGTHMYHNYILPNVTETLSLSLEAEALFIIRR